MQRGQLEVSGKVVENQAVYLPCWVENPKDKAAVIVAAGAAQRAADLILGCLQEESEEEAA